MFAVGGRDGSSCLNTVEWYSPHTDSWMTCSPMNRCRAGPGVAACNEFIYVVGGHDSDGGPTPSPVRLDSVERWWKFAVISRDVYKARGVKAKAKAKAKAKDMQGQG